MKRIGYFCPSRGLGSNGTEKAVKPLRAYFVLASSLRLAAQARHVAKHTAKLPTFAAALQTPTTVGNAKPALFATISQVLQRSEQATELNCLFCSVAPQTPRSPVRALKRRNNLSCSGGLGCNHYQGFYLARPMPLVSFVSLFQGRTSRSNIYAPATISIADRGCRSAGGKPFISASRISGTLLSRSS